MLPILGKLALTLALPILYSTVAYLTLLAVEKSLNTNPYKDSN